MKLIIECPFCGSSLFVMVEKRLFAIDGLDDSGEFLFTRQAIENPLRYNCTACKREYSSRDEFVFAETCRHDHLFS